MSMNEDDKEQLEQFLFEGRAFRTVTIESPYAGDVEQNLRYLDACIYDCLKNGLTPYASHKMLTTALHDDTLWQRELGLRAGRAMGCSTDERIFFIDRGWSHGMNLAKRHYERKGLSYLVKRLGFPWSEQ